jgi:hypothetical protein
MSPLYHLQLLRFSDWYQRVQRLPDHPRTGHQLVGQRGVHAGGADAPNRFRSTKPMCFQISDIERGPALDQIPSIVGVPT